MDVATMVAINNLNMLTMMSAMQQTQNFITIIDGEKEYHETPKKGTQLINRNMIRNITFDNK